MLIATPKTWFEFNGYSDKQIPKKTNSSSWWLFGISSKASKAQLRCYALPDFPPKALEEEGVGGFNLLPSTGPVATWMGCCLSSQRGLKHMNLEVRLLPGPCCFRPRVLALFLLGESKADV